jgi:hypothetical protein
MRRLVFALLFVCAAIAQTPVVGGNSLTTIVAKADATAQSANIATTTLYTVPANGAGMYRVSCYVVVTRAATTSSTMPACTVGWVDADTAVFANPYVSTTSTANAVGPSSAWQAGGGTGLMIINVAANTNIQYTTSSYASSGATPMLYAVHIKLEYLGQ